MCHLKFGPHGREFLLKFGGTQIERVEFHRKFDVLQYFGVDGFLFLEVEPHELHRQVRR